MANVRNAVYNSNWYEGDKKFAGKMLVILAVTQKDVYFQAGGLSDINIAVLTKVNKLRIQSYINANYL